METLDDEDQFIDLIVSDGQCYAIYAEKYGKFKWIPQDKTEM